MVTNLARTWGERFLQPVARFLQHLGITPNTVTVLGFLLTAGVCVILASGQYQLGGVLLILTLGGDAIDGTLARVTNSVTRFGAFLDSTLDRWAEVLLFGAIGYSYLRAGNETGVILAFAALSASLLVSYTRARAEGVGLVCKGGLLTRLERLVLLIAGLIIEQVIWSLGIIAALATFTALQRIWITWQADQKG